MNRLRIPILIGVFILSAFVVAPSQSTGFSYQGTLRNGSASATGQFDFEFALFSVISGGTQIGTTRQINDVAVQNGLFSVVLDFGSAFSGADRYLEIRVRPTGNGGFTTLSPRHLFSSVPYAIRSISSNSADTASSVSGSFGGDVSGIQSSTVVTKLRGRDIDSTAPQSGQVLVYDGGNGRWMPTSITTPISASSNYLFAYRTTDLIFAPNTWTPVSFSNDAQINGWSNSGSGNAYVCGSSGVYRIVYSVSIYKYRIGVGPSIRLLKNDIEIIGSIAGIGAATSDYDHFGTISNDVIVAAAAGDSIKLQVICGADQVSTCRLDHPESMFGSSIPTASLSITRVP